MKDKDVMIGMRVIPYQKTAPASTPSWHGLDNSNVWANKPSSQHFLYVTGYTLESGRTVYLLNHSNEYGGDYFHAEDFVPYPSNGIPPLYCVACEEMVEPFHGPYKELHHTYWEPWIDPETRQEFADFRHCDFPSGYASCPPPPFDLDEYIERVGNPPFEIVEDFRPYTYDVETDQIVEELP